MRLDLRPRCPKPQDDMSTDSTANTAPTSTRMGHYAHTDLLPFAKTYVWWKSPEEALAFPERVIAQVMDIGTHEDIQALTRLVGDETLRQVLTHAQAGQFRPRSWAYWHYRLGLAEVDQVPPLPSRKF